MEICKFICLNCRHEITWQCDYTFEDFMVEGDGVVSTFYCPHCHADIVCYTPSEVDDD